MVIYHIDMVVLDRYGRWANDMGDDSIDMVISHIDMGYLVTLRRNRREIREEVSCANIGFTY